MLFHKWLQNPASEICVHFLAFAGGLHAAAASTEKGSNVITFCGDWLSNFWTNHGALQGLQKHFQKWDAIPSFPILVLKNDGCNVGVSFKIFISLLGFDGLRMVSTAPLDGFESKAKAGKQSDFLSLQHKVPPKRQPCLFGKVLIAEIWSIPSCWDLTDTKSREPCAEASPEAYLSSAAHFFFCRY